LTVKAGAKVRVRLTMAPPTRHYHVALVDPLPAGFEALNPELAITGHISHKTPTIKRKDCNGPGIGSSIRT
jgi:alpha-2-macroglobulin